jgi:drug/metabolite transporter (DMT)-like permease
MIKLALREMSVETIIFVRYGLTSAILLAMMLATRQPTKIERKDWKWVVILGLIVYIASPLLAFNGMRLSQALDVSVLVSLEPLATAILAYLFIHEKLTVPQRWAFVLAIPGVLLLSGIHHVQLASTTGATTLRLLGNSLFLASLFCEGCHTVFGRALTNRYSPLTLSAFSFTIGFLFFAMFQWKQVTILSTHHYSWSTWGAILYVTVLCSAFGYTVWFYLLKRLTANTVAISLYLQSVAGALIGYFFLGERLEGWGWFGATLILFAVTLGLIQRNKITKPNREVA